jgi:hypothetical protein
MLGKTSTSVYSPFYIRLFLVSSTSREIHCRNEQCFENDILHRKYCCTSDNKAARLLKSEVDLRRVDIKIVAKSVFDYRTRLADLVDGYKPQMKNNKASTHIQLNI